MIFKRLKLVNFMSIKEAEIALDKQGLVLIQGLNADDSAFDSNGAGKSSIFEGLTNVLFDRTVRGLKGDDVINEDIGKNCSQVLEMVDNDGVEYVISRYRKHKEHKNSVYVHRAGENITPKSSKDTNDFIEKLIGMDFDIFTNSILFGQGAIKMFSIASDADKKAILENILNLTVLQDALSKAKELVTATKGEIDSLVHKVQMNKERVDACESDVERLTEQQEEINRNVDAHIRDANNKIVFIEGEKESISNLITELEGTLPELERKLEDAEGIAENFKKFDELNTKLQIRIGTLANEMASGNKELAKLKAEVGKLKAGEGTNCVACGQVVTPETVEQSIEHVKEKMIEALETVKKAKADTEKAQESAKQLEEKLAEKEVISEKVRQLTNEISEVLAKIAFKKQELKGYEKQREHVEQYIATWESKRGQEFEKIIEDKKAEIKEKQAETRKYNKDLKVKRETLKMYEFWVKGFGNSGVKSYLLDSVTPFLNKKANYYLSKLSGSTTEIKFSTKTLLKSGEEREKFDVQILNKVGGGAYSKNSTGEKRRIDLAIALALQDLVMSRSTGKLNILLYDEAFDGLDAVGCENVVQLLHEISKEVSSVFVITHNDHLKPFFDNQLTVIKENGQTTIKQ